MFTRQLKFKFVSYINCTKMCTYTEGQLFCPRNELNMDHTLLGGQSFRWKKCIKGENIESWQGIAYDCYWQLSQNSTFVSYKVFSIIEHPNHFYEEMLRKYFRLNFDLNTNWKEWKTSHEHFANNSKELNAVRVLDQQPLEAIISFICSQNNNIKRISSMVEWLCSRYGNKICSLEGKDYYSFPTLTSLCDNLHELESAMREAKFGYRSKFIFRSVQKIEELGGNNWFSKLRELAYKDARMELVALPGIGFKVADCICLMAFGHLESVPIDTHIFKIAKSSYLPHLGGVNSVTPKVYEEIADNFRKIYGKYAGWTQAVYRCFRTLMNLKRKIRRKKTGEEYLVTATNLQNLLRPENEFVLRLNTTSKRCTLVYGLMQHTYIAFLGIPLKICTIHCSPNIYSH